MTLNVDISIRQGRRLLLGQVSWVDWLVALRDDRAEQVSRRRITAVAHAAVVGVNERLVVGGPVDVLDARRVVHV